MRTENPYVYQQLIQNDFTLFNLPLDQINCLNNCIYSRIDMSTPVMGKQVFKLWRRVIQKIVFLPKERNIVGIQM